MYQNVFLCLALKCRDITSSQVNRLYPIARGINDYRDAATFRAARDQHRHQAYG